MVRGTFLALTSLVGIAAAQVSNPIDSPATVSGALERIVTGQPFSAESTTEVVQTAVDGSHVKRTTTALVARDSNGRTRYSQNLSSLLPGGPRVLTIIRDPVDGVRYVMDSHESVARREQIPSQLPGRKLGTAGGRDSETHQPAETKRSTQPLPTPQEAAMKIARQALTSLLLAHSTTVVQKLHAEVALLGDQIIEGVETSGARATVVVPSGQIGNEKPLTFSSEAWYSPELSIIVMSKVSDPVLGDISVRLGKLRRMEPNPELLAVPAGFRVVGAALSSDPGAQRGKD